MATESDSRLQSETGNRSSCGTVFVSSTYNDLLKYRGVVIQKIYFQAYDPIDAHSTPRGNEETHLFLERLIRRSEIYIGIFGFRYGTRIADDRESISFTEFEYGRAMALLAHHGQTQVYVVVPAPKSRFEAEVLREADTFDHDTYRNDSLRIAEDVERQRRFLERVKSATEFGHGPSDVGAETLRMRTYHRLYNPIDSLDHLGTFVSDLLYALKKSYFESRAEIETRQQGRGLGLSLSSDATSPADFSAGLSVVESRLAEWRTHYTAAGSTPPPALCLLLHGKDAEYTVGVTRALRHANPWDVEDTTHAYQFSKADLQAELAAEGTQNGLLALYRQIYGFLDITPPRELFTPEALAGFILDADPPLMMTICHLNRMQGMLQTFVIQFWQPLYDSLVRLRAQRNIDASQPALLMVTTFAKRIAEDVPLLREAVKASTDYRNVVLVTGLTPQT